MSDIGSYKGDAATPAHTPTDAQLQEDIAEVDVLAPDNAAAANTPSTKQPPQPVEKGVKYFTDYWSQTTAHGLGRAMGAECCSCRQVLWSILFLASLVIFLILMVERINQLNSHPTSTAITYGDRLYTPFPIVTFCNTNAIPPDLPDSTKIFHDNEFLEQNGQNKTSFVRSCLFEGKDCMHAIESRVFQYIPKSLLCFEFSAKRAAGRGITSLTGPHTGLDLELDIAQHTYATTTTSAGVHFVLHDADDEPVPQSAQLYVGPGEHAYFATQFELQEFLKPPWGVCNDPTTRPYSRKACIEKCVAELLPTTCGCSVPLDGKEAPDFCVEDDFGCAYELYATILTSNGSNCNCPFPCNQTQFVSAATKMQWPSRAFSNVVGTRYNATVEYLEENFAKITIFMSTLEWAVVTQDKTYTVMSFLADIGGLLGLFMGISILTLFELVEFGIITSFKLCKPKPKKNT